MDTFCMAAKLSWYAFTNVVHRSNQYSADIFETSFKKDPMNAAEGRRYRKELLEKGGSRPEMETLLGYLGREPRPEALYRELKIAEEDP